MIQICYYVNHPTNINKTTNVSIHVMNRDFFSSFARNTLKNTIISFRKKMYLQEN